MSGDSNAVGYAPTSCADCGSLIYYPDEMVVGAWIHDDGRPEAENDFGALSWEDHGGTVPEGFRVYCLDCTPCECGDHPRLSPHKISSMEDGSWN